MRRFESIASEYKDNNILMNNFLNETKILSYASGVLHSGFAESSDWFLLMCKRLATFQFWDNIHNKLNVTDHCIIFSDLLSVYPQFPIDNFAPENQRNILDGLLENIKSYAAMNNIHVVGFSDYFDNVDFLQECNSIKKSNIYSIFGCDAIFLNNSSNQFGQINTAHWPQILIPPSLTRIFQSSSTKELDLKKVYWYSKVKDDSQFYRFEGFFPNLSGEKMKSKILQIHNSFRGSFGVNHIMKRV